VAKEAVPELIKVFNGEESGLRSFAVASLRRIGPVTKEVVSALNEALKDEDEGIRELAALALKEFKSKGKKR
jgi:HEAT repeat protein